MGLFAPTAGAKDLIIICDAGPAAVPNDDIALDQDGERSTHLSSAEPGEQSDSLVTRKNIQTIFVAMTFQRAKNGDLIGIQAESEKFIWNLNEGIWLSQQESPPSDCTNKI